MTTIEWTEQTWNPIVGCSVATPGCTNCYAMTMANRLANNPATPHYAGTVKKVNGKPVWTGKMAMAPERVLTAPLRRRKPTTYFVNSMGDLFHEDVPDDWIDRVFAVMALCPQHTFQCLTKRAKRMQAYMAADRRDQINAIGGLLVQWADMEDFVEWPLPNVWLGVSVEDQTRADERIPHLLATPAAVRFISAEPLLGPVDLNFVHRHARALDGRNMRAATNALTGDIGYTESCCFPDDWSFQKTGKLDWAIVGGESGPGARPMHPDLARSLRDQCAAAGVPFFFKQWGEWHPCEIGTDPENCHVCYPMPGHQPFDSWNAEIFDGKNHAGWNWRRLGKKAAGRTLDGVVHDGRPG